MRRMLVDDHEAVMGLRQYVCFVQLRACQTQWQIGLGCWRLLFPCGSGCTQPIHSVFGKTAIIGRSNGKVALSGSGGLRPC